MTPRSLALALLLGACLLLLPYMAAQAQGAQALCALEDSTPKVAACLQTVLAARDQALADALQRLRAGWSERDARDRGKDREAMFRVAAALEESQAAWANYRARECSARALTYGYGTGAAAENARCMIELTEQRTDAITRHWH